MLLSILIPAYEEQETIGELLRRALAVDLRAFDFETEIIVCDDGGLDRTAAIVEELGRDHPSLRLVRHARNRGKSSAIRTALAEARGEFVLIQDADLEYEVLDYPFIVSALAAGAEVVYGSRFLARAYPRRMSPSHFFANKLLTASANLLYGLHITDEATALKAFRTDLLRSLPLTSDGFDFCPEVTARLGLRGVPIVEVPVSYSARTRLQGKKIGWRDGLRALRTLVAIRALGRARTP